MKPLRSAAATALLSALLLAPGLALAGEPAPRVVDELPYARQLASSGLGGEPTAALGRHVDQLLTRLQLDDQHAAIDRPSDLHALIMLALEVQLLQERGEDGPALRRAALSAAYMLHLMGHAYDTRQSVRTAIDALPDQVPDTHRAAFEALVQSVRRMRAVGSRWFASALPAALTDDPQSAAVQDQRGLWLLREGHPKRAAEAFALAFRKSELPRHALNLLDALQAAGEKAQAERLEARLVAAAPALSGAIEALEVKLKDAEATAAWEAKPESRYDDVPGCVAQLHRYWRMGRDGAAILLGKRLDEAHFDAPEVRHALAETWLAMRRMGPLQRVLARAEKAGPLDTRMLEARITWAVQMAMPGAPAPLPGTDPGAHLEADLKRLATEGGERGRLAAHAARLLLPIGAQQAAAATGEALDPDQTKRFDAAVEAGLKDLPRSPEMRLLALAAYVASDRALEGVKRVERGLEELAPDARRELSLLMAQIRLGYAVRNRDRAALKTARAELDAIAEGLPAKRPAGWDEPAWRYTRAVAQVTGVVLDGGTLSEAAARGALKALPRPLVDFDAETAAGRIYAQGLAATRGTLLMALDDKEEAIASFGRLRQLAPNEPVSKLLAAQVQLMVGDPNGSWELLSDGLGDLRPFEAFAVHKWRAVAARLSGQLDAARGEARAQLALWDAAHAPEAVESRSPRPLFVGTFNVGLRFMPDEPLQVDVNATPIVLLVPDAPQTRAEVKALAEGAAEK